MRVPHPRSAEVRPETETRVDESIRKYKRGSGDLGLFKYVFDRSRIGKACNGVVLL